MPSTPTAPPWPTRSRRPAATASRTPWSTTPRSAGRHTGWRYRTADDAILLIVSNPLPLTVLRIPLIDSDRLLIALLIASAGSAGTGHAAADPEAGGTGAWTVYGLVAAQARQGSFLKSFVEASLRSRLAAMQDWIVARAAAVARPGSGTGSEAGAGGAGAAQG